MVLLNVELFATESEAMRIREIFREKAIHGDVTFGLGHDVLLLPHALEFVGHGQSSVGDGDLRAYFLVREGNGGPQYDGFCSEHSGDLPYKFVMRDARKVAERLVSSINEYKKRVA